MESTLQQSFQHVKKEIMQLQEQQRLLTRDLEKKMMALQEHQEHKFQQQLEAHKKASNDTSQEVKDAIEALKVEYILTMDEQQNKLAAEKERFAIELGEFQQECLQGLTELNTYTNNEIKNIRKEVKTLIHACTSVFTLREQLQTDLQKHIVVLSTKVNRLKEELEVKTNGFSPV